MKWIIPEAPAAMGKIAHPAGLESRLPKRDGSERDATRFDWAVLGISGGKVVTAAICGAASAITE